MLQAMNTGHDGSLTTVHANSPRDAVARLETMVLMAGLDLPARAIREQIVSAIQLIVHVRRYEDGVRRVESVSEVTGLEGLTLQTQEIFKFDRRGMRGPGRAGVVHVDQHRAPDVRGAAEPRHRAAGQHVPAAADRRRPGGRRRDRERHEQRHGRRCGGQRCLTCWPSAASSPCWA